MAKASIWLKAFDRDKDFVAGKPMRVSGQDFLPGDPFDKTLVSTRRLRQLYEQRKVRMVEDEQKSSGHKQPAPVADLIEIPEDWATKPFLAQKSIARQIKPDLDGKAKKPEIVDIIEAEIARRAGDDQSGPVSAETPENPGLEGGAQSIEIPADWREIPVEDRMALAVALTGEAIGTDEDAVAAIELVIESRAADA